jgi:hypothetical protein
MEHLRVAVVAVAVALGEMDLLLIPELGGLVAVAVAVLGLMAAQVVQEGLILDPDHSPVLALRVQVPLWERAE